MKYTEKDVANIIAQVEEVFTSQFAKAESTSLAKSEDGEMPPKKEHEEKKPEHEEKPAHEASEHKPEGHEGKEEPKAEHGQEGGEPEGHDYDQEDMAHMEKMYRSMSKGELSAHNGCIQKCMGGMGAGMSKAEISSCEPKNTPGEKSPASKEQDNVSKEMKKADGCGGEMAASQPKDTPGAKSPASKEQDKISTEMAKTETGKIESSEPKNTPGAKSPASKAEGMQMEKSENTEVELLKSELAAEKAEKAAIKEFLTALAKKTAPKGKAITSLDVIAKSETSTEEKPLTKSEILEVLKVKTADPSLKKSDRDAVNAFYLTGQVNVNSISHLLK